MLKFIFSARLLRLLFSVKMACKLFFPMQLMSVLSELVQFAILYNLLGTYYGRFHRLGLTPQLANLRLRDNHGSSPACVPSSSVNLTAHLTRDLTSFR